MTSYIFLSFLHLISMSLSFGEYSEESNALYGLPELTRDILEKIKSATGQPINTKRFYPILASPSFGYEIIEQEPLTKYGKYLAVKRKGALEGGQYRTRKGDKNKKHGKDHHYELGETGSEGKESEEHDYGSQSRHQNKYEEGRFTQRNHHESNDGEKENKYKTGRKHGKFHVEKGFRDIYHKDEEKKSDFFWNNKHEEGKWIEYGFKNQKSKKSQDKGEEGKKEKGKQEESSYEKHEDKCSKCKTR